MKIRSLFYHIKDGLKNIYRNRLFSLASIATITACIFLFGVFYALVSNFQYMIHKAENEVCVTVFFDEGLTDADIKKLGDTISQRNEVSRIHYTSADEAWENYKAEYFKDYPELAEGFKDDNPLANSSSYEIYLNEASSQATLVTYLENLDGIRQVNRSEATASGLASAARLVSYITIAIIVILLAVSIFLITNTIVIGITVRKEEISIMKYIGATDAFVNAPFFVEGIVIGLVGSIIPIVILRFVYENIINFVMNKFSILQNILAFMPVNDVFRILVPVGILLGFVTGLVYRKFQPKKWQIFPAALVITLPSTIISSCITAFLFGGITSSGSTVLVQLLAKTPLGMVGSCFVVQFITDYIDRVLCIAVAAVLITALRKSMKENFA